MDPVEAALCSSDCPYCQMPYLQPRGWEVRITPSANGPVTVLAQYYLHCGQQWTELSELPPAGDGMVYAEGIHETGDST